jgi:hypothetical protein
MTAKRKARPRAPALSTRVRSLERQQKEAENMRRDHHRRIARLEQSWESWLKEALGNVLQASHEARSKAEATAQRMDALEIDLTREIRQLGAKLDAFSARV